MAKELRRACVSVASGGAAWRVPAAGYSHDLRSSSVPSLLSAPAEIIAMPWAPAGRFAPHSILIGLPHESFESSLFMYSLRSASLSGHALSGCAADHDG